MEHVGDDASLRALAAVRDDLSTLDDRTQLWNQRECPAFRVLGRPRFEPHEAALQVHLLPPQRQNLGPASRDRDEHELHGVGHVVGQVSADRGELRGVGEALARVVLGR